MSPERDKLGNAGIMNCGRSDHCALKKKEGTKETPLPEISHG